MTVGLRTDNFKGVLKLVNSGNTLEQLLKLLNQFWRPLREIGQSPLTNFTIGRGMTLATELPVESYDWGRAQYT